MRMLLVLLCACRPLPPVAEVENRAPCDVVRTEAGRAWTAEVLDCGEVRVRDRAGVVTAHRRLPRGTQHVGVIDGHLVAWGRGGLWRLEHGAWRARIAGDVVVRRENGRVWIRSRRGPSRARAARAASWPRRAPRSTR